MALFATSCTSAGTTAHQSAHDPTATPTAPPATTAPVAPLALTLDVRQAGASCPEDVVWSPDGRQLAVLVTQGECLVRPATKTPDLMLIYDVASGQVHAQIDLAALLTPAHASIGFDADIFGQSPMSWSPDGRTLAIPVLLWSADSGAPDCVGLLLVPVDGSGANLIVGLRTWVASPGSTVYSYVTRAPIWDVATQTAVSQVALPLPPSPSYGWITPTSIAPSTAAGAFSTWQPGVLAAIPVNHQNAGFPVWEYYSSSTTRWSPDDRSVAADVVTQYLVGASQQAPVEVHGEMCLGERLPLPCATTTLPAPDAAFAAVVARVRAAAESSAPPYPNRVPLAWRPGGGLLAAMLPGGGGISLLNTADGRTDAVAPGAGVTGLVGAPFFCWSPTGQQLAVITFHDDTVQVFDVP
jgi:hypothetical protein